MKTLTIIGGIDGTGKTGLAGVLHSEVANLGEFLYINEYSSACDDLQKLNETILKTIDGFLNKGISFALVSSISSEVSIDIARKARQKGYFIKLYYVGLNTLEESLRRIQNRVAKGGRDVPANIVEREFETRFAYISWMLDYCDEGIFYDNENGFCEVARYINEELQLTGEKHPEWISELYVFLNSENFAAIKESRRLAYDDNAPRYSSIEELKIALDIED